jgi:hypothetical protein
MESLKETVIPLLITFGVASCAIAPSASQPKSHITNSEYRSVILDGETYSEIDLGDMTSWRCKDYFDGGKTVVEVGFFTSTDFHDLGFILYDGTYRGETTNYQRKGVNHRWDWGPNGYEYAFVIKTDGKGLFYDFSGVDNGEKVTANDIYKCHRS